MNQGEALNSPNGTSFGTAGFLANVASPLGYSWTFGYENTGDGDLTEVQFPQGGSLSWAYAPFEYLGERELWQVSNLYLATSAQQSSPYAYSLTWPDASNAVALHTGVALDDATAGTEKYWSFNTGGLVSELQYRTAPGVTSPLPRDETYAWSQDPSGNNFLSSDTTTLDKGQTYQQSTQTQQTQDGYGNVLITTVSDYGNLTTRSYANTYQYQNSTNGSTYASLHIYDRLATTNLTSVTPSLPLVSNVYDAGTLQSTAPTLPFEWDSANYSTSFIYRGNLSQSNTPGRTINTTYDITGTVVTQNDNNGHSVSVATSTATNYTLPDVLSPNGSAILQTLASYNPSFAPASVAGPSQTLYDPTNAPSGTAAYTSYDTYGRVAYTQAPSQSWSSATGAQTNYTYTYASTGWTITATTANTGGNSHWTTTTLDGLGRTARVQSGYGSGAGATTVSTVDTLYAPCACSPLGKMYQQSQPYGPTDTEVYTTYTYDALGRTINVLLPDGASHTTYAYQGNFTTITDPAGNWKQYTSDAFGNLATVLEPDPTVNPVVGPPSPPPAYPVTSGPSGMLLTSYAYDPLNHLTQVAMPRSTAYGMKTQTRTFGYASTSYTTLTLPALWLTSATNPESGTVSYTYNADGTLASKKDANGNTETYQYDAYQRLTSIPDRQQTFTYDTCPTPTNSVVVGCVSAAGKLMQATFGNMIGAQDLSFEYNYSYTPAGKVSSKTLEVQSAAHISMGGIYAYGALTASYTYDNQGALTSIIYPTEETWAVSPTQALSYALDAMERPTALTATWSDGRQPTLWASGATYNAANQPLYGATANRTYNSLQQMTSIAAPGMSMTYNYSPTKNNGQITSSKDNVSGETVSYQYDALKRLLSASGTGWSESYTYDGYGNLTQMSPTGSAPMLSLTVAVDANNVPTNQINALGVIYDSNGNQTKGFGGLLLTYDAANRISAVGGTQSAAYA